MKDAAMTNKQILIGTILICLVVLFSVLSIQELESGDETRVAGIAAEMFIDGDYLIPKLNGMPFMEYPPLFYWAESAAFGVFGFNDFAAKLPAALSAFGCLLLVYLTCRRMKLAVWSSAAGAVILLTSAQFFGRKTCCTVDMTLAFFFMLTLFAILGFVQTRRRHFALWCMIGLTGGVYTKGLLGLGLPVAVFAVWMAIRLVRERNWKSGLMNSAMAATALLTAVFLVGLWYWQIRVQGGEALFHEAFFVNNLGRFSGTQGDHAGPFWFYLKNLPTLFLPWLPLLLFAIWRGIGILRRKHDDALSLILCAVLVPFALFSSSSAKRIVYLLPLAAPCAVLCAWSLENLPEKIIRKLAPGLKRFSAKPLMLYATLLTIAAIALPVDFIRSNINNRKKSLRPLFEVVRQYEAEGKNIYVENSERTRGATVFYLGHTLDVKDKLEEVMYNEYLIFRTKKSQFNGVTYADNHCIAPGQKVMNQ